jgi:hypothetical protein
MMLHPMLPKTLFRFVSILALCVGAAALTGCAATPSKPESIVPPTLNATNKHPQSVAVVVAGGLESNPATKLRLSDATVTEALVASIEKHEVFSRVIKGNGADYQLAVNLISGDFPAFAGTFTVKAELAWSLKRADGKVVWQESIKTEGTSVAGEAFAGVERVRMATERAVRESIAQGLAKISKLNL